MKWFEKTIEYKFIRDFHNLLALPLDGEEEKLGDTIFSDNDKFFIVEFKKEYNPKSEKDKYLDWQLAYEKLRLNSSNQCHFAVYGTEKNNTLVLTQNNYLNFLAGINQEQAGEIIPITLQEVFIRNSIEYSRFKEYASLVMSLKKSKQGEQTSGSVELAKISEDIIVICPNKMVATLSEALATFSNRLTNDNNTPTIAPKLKPRRPF